MKNKFLLMAVISALAALVIVPSTMAVSTDGDDTLIGASVTSGDFILTGYDAFGSVDPIEFGGVAASSSDQTLSVTYDLTAGSNYFELYDYDSNSGANVTIGMTQDFHSTDDSFSASNLIVAMNQSDSAPAQAECSTSSAIRACEVIDARTSDLVNGSMFNIDGSFTEGTFYTTAASATSFTTLLSTAVTNPYVIEFSLEYLKLTVPGNLTPGRYTSTIYVLASQP